MGIDMKGQLTFCLAFYATNPSFLPVFVPPQFVHQKIVLRRAEIYFVRGGWQGKKSVQGGREAGREEKYLSASVTV